MITIEEIEPFKHYWMFNRNHDGKEVWRTVYTISDEVYPHGPMETFILFNGSEKRYPISYFKDPMWKELTLYEINPPKEITQSCTEFF